jgi:hypothetical protein
MGIGRAAIGVASALVAISLLPGFVLADSTPSVISTRCRQPTG